MGSEMCIRDRRHCFYSTESIFYFFAACPIYPAKVSHCYRPTSVDATAVHIVTGITQNIRNRLRTRRQLSTAANLSFCLCVVRERSNASKCVRRPQTKSVERLVFSVFVVVSGRGNARSSSEHVSSDGRTAGGTWSSQWIGKWDSSVFVSIYNVDQRPTRIAMKSLHFVFFSPHAAGDASSVLIAVTR